MRQALLTTCVTAGVIAGLAASPGVSRAQLLGDPERGPVCRRPEVVEFVRRELQRRIAYVRVDGDAVWEEPTDSADTVRCSACVDVRPRFEPPAVDGRACQTHVWEVTDMRTGYVVQGLD